MSIYSILYAYEGLEDRMAKYYKRLAEAFQDDPGAAKLFQSLGNDENQHMLMVADAVAEYKKSPGAFRPIDLDADEVSAVLDRVDAVLGSGKSMSLHDAMKFAMEMEVNCAELSNAIDLAYANPATGRFHKIVLEDQAHLIKLLDFAAARKMDVKTG